MEKEATKRRCYTARRGNARISHFFVAKDFTARCLINKDAEGEIQEKSVEAHCLITEDTVANGKNHEPIYPRR
ncbi:MAG: hypothetical protein AB7I98_14370, partial [Verrucomicrobiales bacterium]